MLRLKCQSTEIFGFAAVVCLAVAPLALALAAVHFVFGGWVLHVAGSLEGRAPTDVHLWSIIELNLLIVREGVNLLNGEEILFVRCKFDVVVADVILA